MAKKRRAGAAGRQAAAGTPAAPAVAAASTSNTPASLRPEPAADGWASTLLALMMLLAPGLGVPGEEMLQDTLKSIIVAFSALFAAALFLLAQKQRTEPLRWHGVLWLPLMLCAYALGSMAWSQPYLAGVEAVRWFVFAVIAWLALNLMTRDRLGVLAFCIQAGALAAALWAAVQFWTGASLFPQGANPSSTFINRNFFAEFVVCTLPFSALLLGQATRRGPIVGLSALIGFIITTILMTGTRAALMALWMQMLVVLPLLAWRCRAQLAWPKWPRSWRLLAPLVMLGTVLALGFIPSGNQKILLEGHGTNALERGFQRTQSIGPKDYSLGVRMLMWQATGNMVQARPLSGVGAGAWENDVPLYQAEGSQLETDYYVHNEFLQLVAEYGLVGWAFLMLLFAYLLLAAWRSWKPGSVEAAADQPWRGVLLCSLLALLLVSNIGFPWRMATTGALFALCLGALAASDARLGFTAPWLARPVRWSPTASQVALAATAVCLVLAGYITRRAVEAERKLVTAVRLALAVTASGNPNDPALAPTRREILDLAREGIALNGHYRKITPMIGDEMARWGDWQNATWVWDSVLASRPNIVAIIGNAARGYSSMGDQQKAWEYLERAKRIQPNAPTVRSLEVILLARAGQEAKALAAAKAAMAENIVDYDLANSLFILSWRAKDYALARQALARRVAGWPQSNAEALVQLGRMTAEEHDDQAKGVEYYRRGLATASPAERETLLGLVPQEVRHLVLEQPQTSANRR